jgi:hypothetical protein
VGGGWVHGGTWRVKQAALLLALGWDADADAPSGVSAGGRFMCRGSRPLSATAPDPYCRCRHRRRLHCAGRSWRLAGSKSLPLESRPCLWLSSALRTSLGGWRLIWGTDLLQCQQQQQQQQQQQEEEGGVGLARSLATSCAPALAGLPQRSTQPTASEAHPWQQRGLPAASASRREGRPAGRALSSRSSSSPH